MNGSLSGGIFAANEVDDRGPPAVGRPTDPADSFGPGLMLVAERGALCHVRTIANPWSNNVPETAANLSKDMGSKSRSLDHELAEPLSVGVAGGLESF